MKRSVYLETSIVSYYTARPSRDLVIAAWQEITHEKSRIIRTIEDHGLVPPEICSPEELVGD